MDLSKLTPAPWYYTPCTFGSPDNLKNPIVGSYVGNYIARMFSCESTLEGMTSLSPSRESAEANSQFIALARNAFGVMMRRGWTVSKHMQHDNRHGWWIVLNEWDEDLFECNEALDATAPDFLTMWPDPFTALVEADKWFKENVEKPI